MQIRRLPWRVDFSRLCANSNRAPGCPTPDFMPRSGEFSPLHCSATSTPEELSAAVPETPTGTSRFWRNLPATMSKEKIRSFVFQAKGSGTFEAGQEREMRGKRAPKATTPLDARKVLRSMQMTPRQLTFLECISIVNCNESTAG